VSALARPCRHSSSIGCSPAWCQPEHRPLAYRDTFRLLLRFASERTGKQPCDLDIGDIDASCVGDFCRSRSRAPQQRAYSHNRLAAVHSLFRYALSNIRARRLDPARPGDPAKSFARNLVVYLDDEEVSVLIAACDSDLDRATRSRHVVPRHPGRAAYLRLADLVRGD